MHDGIRSDDLQDPLLSGNLALANAAFIFAIRMWFTVQMLVDLIRRAFAS